MPSTDRHFFESWEALVDPETGQLNPLLPLGGLWVPNLVEIAGGNLCFEWDLAGDPDHTYRESPPSLLERFLRVRNDDAILRFARQFGPLGVYELDGHLRPDPKRLRASSWLPGSGHRESLESWRRYRREFDDLLALAAQVREGGSIDRDVFVRFEQWYGSPGPLTPLARIMALPWPNVILGNWERSSSSQRRAAAANFLTHRCEVFIESCGLRPALVLSAASSNGSDTVGELVFQDAIGTSSWPGLSLFGALTMQLLAAASGSRFSMCSACGRSFVPRRRKPAFGRRRYCPSCGRRAALRDAKADYRSKLRKLGRKRLGKRPRKNRARSST